MAPGCSLGFMQNASDRFPCADDYQRARARMMAVAPTNGHGLIDWHQDHKVTAFAAAQYITAFESYALFAVLFIR